MEGIWMSYQSTIRDSSGPSEYRLPKRLTVTGWLTAGIKPKPIRCGILLRRIWLALVGTKRCAVSVAVARSSVQARESYETRCPTCLGKGSIYVVPNLKFKWRSPQLVQERHRVIVELRESGLTLKQIGKAITALYGRSGGRALNHSTVLHHLNGDCRCGL